MRASYIVTQVLENEIKVVPDVAGSCATCQKECAKKHPAFSVANPKHIFLQTGDRVKLGSASIAEKIFSVFALVLPFASAVLGFLLSEKSDEKKAMVAVLFFVVGALVVLCASVFRNRVCKKAETLAVTRRV